MTKCRIICIYIYYIRLCTGNRSRLDQDWRVDLAKRKQDQTKEKGKKKKKKKQANQPKNRIGLEAQSISMYAVHYADNGAVPRRHCEQLILGR